MANTNLEKSPIKNYKFWIKIFARVLLVILGVLLLAKNDWAEKIILFFTGGVFVVYSVYRIIPLIKTLEKGLSKVLAIVEIIVDLIIGALLCYLATTKGDSDFTAKVLKHYNILIAVVLWFRGFIYFTQTCLVGEKTDKPKYFIHVAVFTLGSILFVTKIDAEKIALGLAILTFICAAVIIGEGGMEYGKYRKTIKAKREEKPLHEKEEVTEKMPEKEPVVPVEEPKDTDKPFVQ